MNINEMIYEIGLDVCKRQLTDYMLRYGWNPWATWLFW